MCFSLNSKAEGNQSSGYLGNFLACFIVRLDLASSKLVSLNIFPL